jgi:hypothetical protein
VGIRYGKLCPAEDIAGLPSPARALVRDSFQRFTEADRGLVQNRGDKTMDTQATWFCDWLKSSAGFTHVAPIKRLTANQAIALLQAYLDEKAQIPLQQTNEPPCANTLGHYLAAAYAFLADLVDTPFDIYESLGRKQKTLVPFLGES